MRQTRLRLALVFMCIIAGDLARAEQRIAKLREAAASSNSANVKAWADHLQGLIHLYRGEMDSAIEYFREAVDRRHSHHGRAVVDAMAGLILAYQMKGRHEAAERTLKLLRDFVDSVGQRISGVLVSSFESRFSILQGRADVAILRWPEMSELAVEPTLLWWLAIPSLDGCRSLLAEGSQASLRQAEEQLRACEKFSEDAQNTFQLITIHTLLAVVHELQGKIETVHFALERALTLARQGRIVFPFLELGAPMEGLLRRHRGEQTDNAEFIGEILASFDACAARVVAGECPDARVHAELNFLTARELEVLALLNQRLYQKEIAAKLFVSSETVKTHVKHIYQKLGVSGRRQAIEKARADGLIVHSE